MNFLIYCIYLHNVYGKGTTHIANFCVLCICGMFDLVAFATICC